jgi:hypothetical protein
VGYSCCDGDKSIAGEVVAIEDCTTPALYRAGEKGSREKNDKGKAKKPETNNWFSVHFLTS